MQDEQMTRMLRLVRAADQSAKPGKQYVTDYGRGLAEYGPEDDTLWILGNWNDDLRYSEGRWIVPEDMTRNQATIGSRLGNAIEQLVEDVEVLWLDEYERCDCCQMLVRTAADSYEWGMFGSRFEGYLTCATCILANLEDYLPAYTNDPSKALAFEGIQSALEDVGFTKYVEDETDYYPGRYQNGWHRGMDDGPETIALRAENEGWRERIFVVPHVSQFYVDFELWVRDNDSDPNSD